MFKNYVKLAYRNLVRNKVASFINITGLAIAVGCTLVVFAFLETGLMADRFHPDGERVFLVENQIDRSGTLETWADSPHPLGPAMVADFPQIEQFARVEYGGGTMQVGEKVFNESTWYVDPAFLEIFNFPLVLGDPAALYEANTVILSDRLAKKYFGTQNPIGETITFTTGERRMAFTVRGVAAPFPQTASFRFNLLMPYETLRSLPFDDPDDWKAYTGATFIKLHRAEDLPQIAAGMEPYRQLQNASSTDWPIAHFLFDDLYSLSRNSHAVRGDISGGSDPVAYLVMTLLAVFMLALACFNYMNISIATAQRRLKEIGVRKVVGSNRRQLVLQFLSENVLLCLLALGLGVVLAETLMLPGFNLLFADGGSDVVATSFTEGRTWLFLGGLLVLIGLASGAYPALYISRFQPIAIFRGQQALQGKRWFTRVFLTLQFVLAFLTMIAGTLFYQNAVFQEQQDWGYDQEQVVVMRLPNGSSYEVMRQEVVAMPNVVAVTGSVHQPGHSNGYGVFDLRGERVESNRFEVGQGYLETMGLRLQAGQLFGVQHGAEGAASLVVNETFARNQGWTAQDALGQTIRYDSTAYSIIGVLADFHFEDFGDTIEPAVFQLAGEERLRYVSARVQAGTAVATRDAFKALWKQHFPEHPEVVFFQDEIFARYFQENHSIARMFGFNALLALLISCMGLFGLASQNIARRMKEISIRKVLGASVLHVSVLVNRGFFVMLTVAALIAVPLGYVLLEALLEEVYAYHTTIGPMPFVLAYALIFTVALLTIATQIRRVVRTNPAEVLRNE